MKKTKTIFMTLLIVSLLSLCGCQRLENLKNFELPPLPTEGDVPDEASHDDVTVSPNIDTATPYNKIIVSVKPNLEEHYDPQNGTVKILSFSWDTPVVFIEGNEDASAKINEFIATLDETYYTGNDYGLGASTGVNSLLEMAIDNYTVAVDYDIEDMPMELSSSRNTHIKRIDSSVLSLGFTTSEYTGGAHGNYFNSYYVFDTQTGDIVILSDLCADYDKLCDYILDQMCKLYEQDKDGYYSQCISIDFIENGDYKTAFSKLIKDGSWYFDDSGMCIESGIYELGPYAAGIAEFHIPYDKLSHIIDSNWLPTEYTGSGSVDIKSQMEIPDGSIEVIDKITIDEDGDKLCFKATGDIYDVRISKVLYGDKFYETAQLWACSVLSNCIVQFDYTIPDGMPNLMLSYKDCTGEQYNELVTNDGNGNIVLADEKSITAVG